MSGVCVSWIVFKPPLLLLSFDSNCVINLVTDKERVLRHTYNLLKEGGEFYFSDVYASRRVPKHLTQDKVMYAEGKLV
jgi:SAM-dependent methyltransferase